MIREEKIDGGFRIYYHNNVYMGEVLVDEDGYYKFWPEHRDGYWDEGNLLEIANYLHEKNLEWDNQVKEYFTVHKL